MIRKLLLLLFLIMFIGGPFGLHDSVIPGFSIKNGFLYVLAVIFAIETAVTKNRKVEALSVIAPFFLLVAYCILSYATVLLIVKYPDYGIMENAFELKTKLVDHFLMLLVFMYGVTKIDDALWLVRMIVWSVIIGNVLTLADAFGVPDLPFIARSLDGRIQGFIGQMNQFGAFLAFFLPATVALYISQTGFKRLMAGIGVLATFACLLLTFSRGSYVGAIAGSLAASVFLRHFISMRNVINASIAAVVACVLAVPLLILAGYGDLLVERFSLVSGNAHTISQGRSTLWLYALSAMLEHPWTFITGYGWNAYENFRELRLSTHNVYLNHLFNLGAVGLLIFVAILLGVLSRMRRAVSAMSGDVRLFTISAIFGFMALCVAIFFSELYYAGVLFWAYVGLFLRIAIASEFEQANPAGETADRKKSQRPRVSGFGGRVGGVASTRRLG